jgi:hypothetical protein
MCAGVVAGLTAIWRRRLCVCHHAEDDGTDAPELGVDCVWLVLLWNPG